MDEEIKKEEKVTPSNGVDRPESPSPDYSNSPSPEPRRRQVSLIAILQTKKGINYC